MRIHWLLNSANFLLSSTIYNEYIKDEFEDYPLWVRSIYCPPAVLFGNKWSFWQYMDTAMLEGYMGDQKYIDVNVFNGTHEDLEQLIIQKTECMNVDNDVD